MSFNKFPKLQSLSLSNITSDHPDHLWSGLPFSSNIWPSTLTCLELNLSACNSIVIDIKEGWANIRSLTLSGNWSLVGMEEAKDDLGNVFPSLTSLALWAPHGLASLSWINSLPLLTSLTISNLDIDHIPELILHLNHIKRLELENLFTFHSLDHVVSSLMTLISPNSMDSMRKGASCGGHHLNHLGLEVPRYKDSESGQWSSSHSAFESHQLDELLRTLIRVVPSFTIMDGSIDFMKWISSNVINGSLPLLQICYIKEQRVDENGVYRHSHRTISSFTRHQILKGAMIHFINGSQYDNYGNNKDFLDTRASSLSNTSSDWQSLSLDSMASNNTIIRHADMIFSYIRGWEKLIIIERVCRSWLNASKVNGCGWRSVMISNNNRLSPNVHTLNLLSWKYLIGTNRFSLCRHVTLGQKGEGKLVFDGLYYIRPILTKLCEWFPNLSSLHLNIVTEGSCRILLACHGSFLSPLHHCLRLTKLSITTDHVLVRTSTKEWTWKNIPPSVTHLHLTYLNCWKSTKLAIPITWQQQLQSLTLKGSWLPSFHQITQPWLSLTSLGYHLSNDDTPRNNQISSFPMDLFSNKRSHLFPNLINLHLKGLTEEVPGVITKQH
jgi:hypothetical protein